MSSQDFYNNGTVQRAISAQAVSDNTAQVGQIIDTQFYESLTFYIDIGTLADVDATFTVLLEDSDDSGMSGAVAVADDFLLGTEAAASFQFDDDNEVRKLGYVGKQRYVRMTITPVGNTGSATFGAIAVQGAARHGPAA